VQRTPTHVVALGLLVAVVAVVGWWGALALGPGAGPDAPEHIRFAQYFDATGHLPPKDQNYEYASPPAFAVGAVYLQRAARFLSLPDGAPLPFLPAALARLALLAALAAAGAVLAARGASSRARLVAAGAAGIAVVLALVAALAHARAVPWSSGQLISLASACGLVVLTWAIAQRLFARTVLPLAAAAFTAALPIVLREAVVFHPELLFAVLVAGAVLALVRAAESEFPPGPAVAVGVLVGAAALTRQTAAIVAVALAAAALLLGRRRAVRFVVIAAVSLAVVAGPWWIYQASRFGNPIQSNLDRPGYMLRNGEPRTFYVSFPLRDLVSHPYRDRFANELLPKFHADLWSDWYGVDRGFWRTPSGTDRVLASSQSVLGLGGDALVLLGLAVGLRALARGRPAQSTLTILFVLSWAGFVVTLVRFPQASGDPIKASYLLFLAQAAAVFAVAAGERLWRRGHAWRGALLAAATLYAISYVAVLATTY
jgi:Dolichyl-phosphate-mannose-protein mannosyltransferase